jgi:hypothetical protein
VTAKAPACLVDVGPDPKIHALDLERLDEKGAVVESIRRWINRPSAVGKVRAVGSCDEKKRQCEFHVQWAHPAKLDPIAVTVALDGKRISEGVKPLVRYSFPKGKTPQVLTVDAEFPDGRRADFTKLLHGFYPEQASASLHPVPIELGSPKEADGLAGSAARRRLEGPRERKETPRSCLSSSPRRCRATRRALSRSRRTP